MGKDSSELLWDDINRPLFYTLLTGASATIRLALYPAALVKTRLQASSNATTTAQPAHATGSRLHIPYATTASVPPSASVAGVPSHSSVPMYRGTGDAFRTIMRTEGKFALYRGFRVNVMGLACDPLVIGCIEYSRTELTRIIEASKHHVFFKYVLSPSTTITLITAGGAACIGQVIQVPVDVISQKKQMQTHPLPKSLLAMGPPGTSGLAIGKQIVQQEGISGLYKGFGITLCTAMPFTAILWAVYWPSQRAIHSFLTRSFEGEPVQLQEEHAHVKHQEEYWGHYDEKDSQQTQLNTHSSGTKSATFSFNNKWFRETFPTPAAAFVASAAASLATQPIDVIKTRLQVQGGASSIMSVFRSLVHERGLKGLASGWYPRLLVVTPQQVIMMSSYEALKRYCQK